jgi:hypothetical protein
VKYSFLQTQNGEKNQSWPPKQHFTALESNEGVRVNIPRIEN